MHFCCRKAKNSCCFAPKTLIYGIFVAIVAKTQDTRFTNKILRKLGQSRPKNGIIGRVFWGFLGVSLRAFGAQLGSNRPCKSSLAVNSGRLRSWTMCSASGTSCHLKDGPRQPSPPMGEQANCNDGTEAVKSSPLIHCHKNITIPTGDVIS